MFPIRDHTPSGRTPWVTLALIAVNLGVLLATLPLESHPAGLIRLYDAFALVPAAPRPSTFVTAMFLHGGLVHFATNMLVLWIFGDNLEARMGHPGFLLFYLCCGILAGAAHVLASPGSEVPMLGASGAIAGVMGGYLLLYPRARVDILVFLVVAVRIVPVPAASLIAVWLGAQLVGGLVSPADAGGIAHWAHAGGFLAGLVLTLPLWRRLGGRGFWRRTRGMPSAPGTGFRPSQVPVVRRRR